jgi:hypothetical protein
VEISRGKIEGAQKVCLYGPEGIGKSTFASMFPNPIFIDTEGSTKKLDVARTKPNPSSWTMLLEQVKYFRANPKECDTLIIDTADWAERLCKEELLSKAQKDSLSKFSHGQGYVILFEEFGRLLNLLEELVEKGINVVITAHATMRKFEQPDEMGGYDRWELKLEKKTAPLIKEWSDIILFANYKTFAVKGQDERKNKVQGGKRVMYTSHHPCWDAKNRHGLPDELPFDYKAIEHCIPARTGKPETKPIETDSPFLDDDPALKEQAPKEQSAPEPPKNPPQAEPPKEKPQDLQGIPKPLADLMSTNSVTVEEIQWAVSSKGYYPKNTPIENYDPQFITGVLVGAWVQVFKMIQDYRNDVPY